jgi:carnitine O-acetyltransferase
MYRDQAALPPLPVPTVEETMRTYLQALKPLVSKDVFVAAQSHAEDFARSREAQKLQSHLLRQQQVTPNWLERLWSDSYLLDRSSPGLHVSPVLGFDSKYITHPLGNDSLTVAAYMAAAAVRFHRNIEAEMLEPNAVRGKPFCMQDFNAMLGSTRIPCVGRDVVVKACPPRGTYGHCVVMCRGRAYFLPLCTPDWIASVDELRVSLARIRKAADAALPSRVGTLTYLHRDDWAAVRARLLASPINRFALHRIESALFVLSLDDATPGDDNADTIHALMHGHSGRSAEDKSWDHLNRWWDKSLHLHTARDGRAGLTFEHSAQDSLPILTYTSFLAKFIADATTGASPTHMSTAESNSSAKGDTKAHAWDEIHFTEDDDYLNAAIDRGTKLLSGTLAKLNIAMRAVPLDTQRFKVQRLSPDCAVQAALQIGFRACRNNAAPSAYESAATKTFRHGRTETLRPLSSAMAALVDTLLALDAKDPSAPKLQERPSTTAPQAKNAIATSKPAQGTASITQTEDDNKQLLQLFAAACKMHADYARKAAAGKGCDRHMMGLRCAAEELGLAIPQVLNDEAFHLFQTITLSTTHPFWQKGTRLVGFGPVVSPVCVGCGYFVTPSDVTLGVSTWRRDDSDVSSQLAAEATERVILRLQRAVQAAPLPQSAKANAPKAKL